MEPWFDTVAKMFAEGVWDSPAGAALGRRHHRGSDAGLPGPANAGLGRQVSRQCQRLL